MILFLLWKEGTSFLTESKARTGEDRGITDPSGKAWQNVHNSVSLILKDWSDTGVAVITIYVVVKLHICGSHQQPLHILRTQTDQRSERFNQYTTCARNKSFGLSWRIWSPLGHFFYLFSFFPSGKNKSKRMGAGSCPLSPPYIHCIIRCSIATLMCTSRRRRRGIGHHGIAQK